MIYLKRNHEDPVISQKTRLFSNHANLNYLPQRTFLRDPQVGICEKRNPCKLQQMRYVGLEKSVKRQVGFGDIKGEKSIL